ncbi:DNA-binding protein [Candidatus Parcubacteria bacterium]|nr:MAG: DNA-binding protein [Candidatus Parcubacteria bacterium]
MISIEGIQNPDQVSPKNEPYVYYVRGEPLMQAALDVFTLINKHGKSILLAKGNSIPSAVAIANIIVEKMLNRVCIVEHITLDSENIYGKKMLSSIEISLVRK